VNPQAFAEQVLDLLGRSAAERRAIAGRANLESVRWKTRLQPLMPLLEAAASQK
jgi:hypothetical protein